MIRLLILSIAFFTSISIIRAQIADAFPGCLQVALQEGVVCGGGTSFFGINGSDQFEVNNIDGITCCGGSPGGDTESYFQLEVLDITCYTDIFISCDYSASATDYEDDSPAAPLFGCTGLGVPDNSHDQIVFTYILDGGPEVQDLYVHGETQADFTGNWTTGPLNGNSLIIKIYASNKASAEAFYFENLTVDGSSLLLAAGTDDVVCSGTNYTLQGSGCGIWSGGLGTFSDISDPTATYTFDPSEINTDVILTFSANPITVGCNNSIPGASESITLSYANLDATDPMISGCSSDLSTYDLNPEEPNVNSTETVTWYDGQPSTGGSLISPDNNVDISSAGGIDLWALVTDANGCTAEVQVTIEEQPGPIGELSGTADLCPGECAEINVNFTGGTSPYLINITLFSVVTTPFAGFEASDKITICFDNGAPILDLDNFTINVPNVLPIDFTLDLSLDAVEDSDGCVGTVQGGSINISFNQAPDIINPGELTACDNGDGTGTYDLTELDDIINDGTGLPVIYFDDPFGTNILTSPLTTVPTTIYATVEENPCNSDTIGFALSLAVADGMIELYCDDPMISDCEVCSPDGSPVSIMPTIIITPDDVTSFTIELSDATGTPYSTLTFNNPSNGDPYVFPITETTTFTIMAVTGGSSCFDPAAFPSTTVTILSPPTFDDPGGLSGCPSVILPAFTNVSAGATPSYWTEMNGMGTQYMPGDEITDDLQLYAYAGSGECALEYPVFVDIVTQGILAPIDDVNQCGPYTLPIIDGVGADGAVYYNMPGGAGNVFNPGDVITTTMTLYAFLDCGSVEESFTVTIEAGGSIDPQSAVAECGGYTLPIITGTNVDDALYYTESGGMGDTLAPGDVVTTSQTLYMYSPCSTNEELLPIIIAAGPTFDVNDTTVCELYIVEAITGSGLDGDEAYYSGAGGTGSPIAVGDSITTDSIIYLYDPLVDCQQDIAISITVRTPYYGGMDTLVTICAGDATDYSSYELIGGADTVGFWIDFATFDTLGRLDTFNFGTFTPGNYNYIYVIEDSICAGDDRLLSIDIVDDAGADAGTDLTLNLCTTDQIDFDNAYQGYPVGGFWSTIENGDTTLFDVSLYTLADQSAGIDTFLYTVDNGSCGSDDALLIIEVEVGLSAGDDVPIVVCGDTLIMLDAVLSNADDVGTYSETVVSGGLTGNIFNTTGLAEGVYPIIHTVNNANCPPDQALIVVNVSSGPSAGDDVNEQTCDSNVNLFDFLSGTADAGGTFFFMGDEVVDGLVTINPGQTRTYQYVIGDDIDCPSDQADITISFATVPDAGFLIPLNFCLDGCRNFRVVIEDIDTLYVTITDGVDSYPLVLPVPPSDTASIELCNIDDGIFEGTNLEPNMVYNIIIDSLFSSVEDCIFPSTLMSSDIRTNVYESDLVEFFCSDTTIAIEGIVFDESNPSGTVTIAGGGQAGCDSLVNVDLTFGDVNFGNITYTACTGADFVDPDFGLIWSETNSMDDVVIPNGSSTNCDSIVSVTVVFTDAVITPMQEMICEEDSITILGTIFWAGNTGDTLNTGELSVNGCDSLVAVQLSFFIESPRIFAGPVCENFTEEVAPGIVLSSDNFGEAFVIGQTENGCDSVIINQYEYILPSASSSIDTAVCDLTYTLEVIDADGNAVIFDQSNPAGEVSYPAQDLVTCDSVVTVNIAYGEMAVDFELDQPTCSVNSNGIILLNSISDPGPYSYSVDGGFTLFEQVPLQVFPDTDMGILTVTSSVTGCSVDLPYEFVPVDIADYEVSLSADSMLVITEANATPIVSISWTPSEGLSCTDCENPIATPTETTTYIATIEYGDGCFAEVEITVTVDIPEPPVGEYFVPNIFNPTSTSGNGTFAIIPSTLATGQVSSMSIYDRWGNLVYRSTDADFLTSGGGWDGRKGGTVVAQGVYVYQIIVIEQEADGQPKTITIVGDITLLQ